MDKIVLNTKTEEIKLWIADLFKDGNISYDKSVCHNDFVLYYYCSKKEIFRISGKIFKEFDDKFSEFYYYENDFRNFIKEFLIINKNIKIKKVWIGC